MAERCDTGCHGLDRVASGRGDEARWRVIVDRMIGYGARLDSAEETRIVEYLAATYPY